MWTCSVTLEIVERLAAALAAPQRLAGGRAEFGEPFGILRTASRTCDLLHAEQRAARVRGQRRRNAVFPKLAAAVLAYPVGGPGRRQHGADVWMTKTFALQRQFDLQRDHVHRRTAGISRRDRDLDPAVMNCDLAEHAEIGDGEYRDFGIDHECRNFPCTLAQIRINESGRYHVASGKVRCIDCSSLRRWPRCSLCRPLRPPCCIHSLVGSASVASLTTSDSVSSQGARKLAESMAMPASTSARSLSSSQNISPVKAQRSSIALCARAWLSSVPSPSRTIHSEECLK